jgi:spore coat polysaccharide biosynthesis protein SpsF (cytidylyltransferase family)
MRVVAIVQARLGSQRLPSKVLMPICGQPMISWVLQRAKQIPGVDQVVLAVPHEDHEVFRRLDLKVEIEALVCGSPEPLERYVYAASALLMEDSDYVVRITGDCPGLDPEVSGKVVRLALDNNLPYAANVLEWPDGLDTECFTVGMLRKWADAAYGQESDMSSASEAREHVTPWLRGEMRSYGLLGACELPGGPGRGWKWSVDDEEDLEYVRELYRALGPDWGYREALGVLPGALCPLCADGVPNPKRSLTSIGGPPTHVIEDLHEVEVSGGVSYAPCEAWQIAKRRSGHQGPPSAPDA